MVWQAEQMKAATVQNQSELEISGIWQFLCSIYIYFILHWLSKHCLRLLSLIFFYFISTQIGCCVVVNTLRNCVGVEMRNTFIKYTVTMEWDWLDTRDKALLTHLSSAIAPFSAYVSFSLTRTDLPNFCAFFYHPVLLHAHTRSH